VISITEELSVGFPSTVADAIILMRTVALSP
jgi:hypothetical protein